MSDNIVIRLRADASEPVEWILTDSSGARHGAPSRGTLHEAADAAGGRRVLVLLPAGQFLITSADVPAKGSRLLQALPFALEEQLAEDVDKLHFAAGARRSNGHTPVAIIERARFDDYLSRLRGAGLKPNGLYAATQGLARTPGTISMLIDDGEILINDGADIELALQGMSPGDALVAIGALDDAAHQAQQQDADDAIGAPTRLPAHVLVYLNADDNERYSNDWLALRNELESLDTRILPDGALPRLAATVSTGKAINLLQGSYAPKAELAAEWKPWRNVALLLVAIGAISIVGKVADYFSLKRAEQRLQISVEEQFRRTLPWIENIRDPKAQLQAELNRMGARDASAASTDFLDALAALSSAVKAAPGTRIEGISFRSGVTDIQLRASDVAALEKIQQAVRERAPLDASIERADNSESGVMSRIQIKAAAR